MWCGLPALILFAGWLAFEDPTITGMVVSELLETMRSGVTGCEIT